jgi:hypothetical protein
MTRDDLLTHGHQLQIRRRDGKLAVTCPCLLTRVSGDLVQARNRAGVIIGEWRPSYWQRRVIEARTSFPVAEAMAAWRDWHEREGITL